MEGENKALRGACIFVHDGNKFSDQPVNDYLKVYFHANKLQSQLDAIRKRAVEIRNMPSDCERDLVTDRYIGDLASDTFKEE